MKGRRIIAVTAAASSMFPQLLLGDLEEYVHVDNFAGGGGASVGYEMATGRQTDVAINHSEDALQMHGANHSNTVHIRSDVYDVNPRLVLQGRKCGSAWFSPDCTGFSRAKGSKPERDATKKRRSLAWVVRLWAGTVRPLVIFLENVMEFTYWTRLVGPKDNLRECKKTRGKRFKKLVRILREMGYKVEWRMLSACDYGAATIRKRLFLVATLLDSPIVWPEPTHGDPASEEVRSGRRKPWDVTANHIDWSQPMLSIFASREDAKAFSKLHGVGIPQRPLKPNTYGRVGRGVKRYVVESKKPYTKRVPWSTIGRDDFSVAPFTASTAHGETSPSGAKRRGTGHRELTVPLGTLTGSNDSALVAPIIVNAANSKTTGRGPNTWSIEEPLRTITSSNGYTVVAPVIMPITHAGDRAGVSPERPLPTITCANRGELALVVSCLVPRYGERPGQEPRCRSIEAPAPTIVNTDNGGMLVVAHVQTMRNAEKPFAAADEPAHTITAGGAGLCIVAAHVSTYHGTNDGAGPGGSITQPMPTQTAKDRHSLVAAMLATNNGGFAEGNSGDGRNLDAPAATITGKGANHALIAPMLDQANNGFENRVGRSIEAPLSTICTESRGHQGLIAASMAKLRGTSTDEDPAAPLDTISAKGQHHALVASHIQRDFGQSTGHGMEEPLGTISASGNGKAALVASFLEEVAGIKPGKHGFVWVTIKRKRYFIADILMRMLTPRELYSCQGFPKTYIIDRGADGRVFTKSQQVQMVGNSVSPQVACALIRANAPHMVRRTAKELAHA